MNDTPQSAIQSLIQHSRQDDVLVLTIDNPPVNALSVAVVEGIHAGLDIAEHDDSIKAVLIQGAGRHFIAGVDIRLFGLPREQWPDLRGLVSRLDQFPKPTIAFIHGSCLGGGLELALACHYRVAESTAQLGFPEVNLGILPAAGGTQRLIRLIGIEKSLVMMLTGKPILAKEARDLQLVDACMLAEDVLNWIQTIKAERPLPRVSEKSVVSDLSLPERMKLFMNVRKNQKQAGASVAAGYIVDLLEIASMRAFTDGWAAEARLFGLLDTNQSKALQHLFFAERARRKVEGISAQTPIRDIRRVGVVGAGVMGTGIVISLLNAGLYVVLVEQSQAALTRGMARLMQTYEASVAKEKLTSAEMKQRLEHLTSSHDLQSLVGVDLIIEAISENIVAKKALFAQLDSIEGALLATNTSALSIDELAEITSRPGDVVGLHFMNPAHIMKLLEVVRGEKTSLETLASVLDLARRLGKIAVVVGDQYGFVGNRMILPYLQRARELVLTGISVEQIDEWMRQFGFRIGPFELSDLAGLDIGQSVRRGAVHAQFPSDWVDELVNMGRLGQKTDAGIYDYVEGIAISSAVTTELIETYRNVASQEKSMPTGDEVVQQLVFTLVNEGAKVLSEGIATRASDIDLIYVAGYGFPRLKGGPMHYADQQGLARVVASLKDWGITPAPLLEQLAREEKTFALYDASIMK